MIFMVPMHFRKIRAGLNNTSDYCMVGYRLENTLSDNGAVSRGVCDIREGCLTDINEHTSLTKESGLDPATVVSMNMWGASAGYISGTEKAVWRISQDRGY